MSSRSSVSRKSLGHWRGTTADGDRKYDRGASAINRHYRAGRGSPADVTEFDTLVRPSQQRTQRDVPRVSIVLPSYNHDRFVASALDSILAQTYQDFEIIITDDGSTDRSIDVLRTYERADSRIKLLLNRFNYETHSLNKCVHQARGEYIAVAHSDDEFAPSKLEQQVNFLDKHPEVAAVFTAARIVNQLGQELPNYTLFDNTNRSRHEWLRHFFLKGNCLCHPSVLIRRSVHDSVGLYNPLLGALDDLDMWVRVCLHHDIHVLPETLVNFRILDWSGNASGDKPENFRRGQYETIKILDHFQRPKGLAQLHLIFREAADQILHSSHAEKRYFLAMMALNAGHLAHRFWGIDLLYRLLSNRETRSQLEFSLSNAPEGDFIRMNGNLNPFTVQHRPAVQVFWPVTGAHSELNSRSAYYAPEEWREVRIPVPAWDTATPLRVDPCDFPCVVKISELRILSRTDGRCLWRACLKDRERTVMLSGTAVWLSDEHNISILSTGADPQIYLNTIPRLPEVPLELQLWIKAERDLESVSREMASRRDAAQAEVVTLREALAQAVRAEQERAVTAEVAQAEVVTLREALAQAVRAEQERAVTAEVAQAEAVTLSETLAKAEREAEQRAAAVAALQADVVALQGTLTAAREVGKAAIAALRIDTVVPAKPDGSRGWRQLAMRFLLPERVKIGGHGLVQHSDRVAKNRMAASLAGGLLWRRKPSVISPACLVDGCGRHTGDLGA
jgi:glycosyltransferase involved in cell wall biosynthesis